MNLMTRETLIQKTIDHLAKLPDQKLQEVSDFAEAVEHVKPADIELITHVTDHVLVPGHGEATLVMCDCSKPWAGIVSYPTLPELLRAMPKDAPRLYLITPPISDWTPYPPLFETAIAACDVACVLLRTSADDWGEKEWIVRALDSREAGSQHFAFVFAAA